MKREWRVLNEYVEVWFPVEKDSDGYPRSITGYKKVDLYIKATNPDLSVAKIVDFAKGGKQNLLEITKGGAIKSITIVLKDGVVRIPGGKVYAGIAQ